MGRNTIIRTSVQTDNGIITIDDFKTCKCVFINNEYKKLRKVNNNIHILNYTTNNIGHQGRKVGTKNRVKKSDLIAQQTSLLNKISVYENILF
jgi:hypothetical protein